MNVNKALFTFIKIAFSVMIILILVYWAVKLCSVSYDYGYRLFTEPAVSAEPGRDVLVQIKRDMSNRQIAELMEEKGLVRDAKLFYIQLMLSDYKDDIKPGVYTLNTSMEPKELMIEMSPEPVENETEEPDDEIGSESESMDTEDDFEDYSDADGEGL